MEFYYRTFFAWEAMIFFPFLILFTRRKKLTLEFFEENHTCIKHFRSPKVTLDAIFYSVLLEMLGDTFEGGGGYQLTQLSWVVTCQRRGFFGRPIQLFFMAVNPFAMWISVSLSLSTFRVLIVLNVRKYDAFKFIFGGSKNHKVMYKCLFQYDTNVAISGNLDISNCLLKAQSFASIWMSFSCTLYNFNCT